MTTGRIEVGPSGRTVAANVKRLRETRGLTLRALSVALKDQGRSLSADALNKIENGASDEPRAIRRVDVDDLVALAVVLGVSPVTLLLPSDARGETEVTGAGRVRSHDAWMWAWCNDPLVLPEGGEEADRAGTEFLLNSRPIGLFSAQGDDRLMPFAPRRPRGSGG
ncbi:helix-turn-helix domain-containing protein [Kitasatospora sp. NPDC058218]|uniref:helix-turn-helix domain-containing protein n=1 Tax=Kitasatospora sp. NPDC058218 TaxID=3346385 RepID=UPI0036D7F15A